MSHNNNDDTNVNDKTKALINKYSKKAMITIGANMNPKVKLYKSYSKQKIAQLLIDRGYSDQSSDPDLEDETESERANDDSNDDDNNNNRNKNNHNNNNRNNNNHNNNNRNSNEAKDDQNEDEDEQQQNEKEELDAKLNQEGHNIHFDISAPTITEIIGYQKFRRTMIKNPDKLEEYLQEDIIEYLNDCSDDFNLKTEKISVSFTATSKAAKTQKLAMIKDKTSQKAANWRNGQQKSIKDRMANTLQQFDGGGLMMMYDVLGRAEGLARKATIHYFGAFDDAEDEEMVKAQKEVNKAVGKLVSLAVERAITAKESNKKEIILVRDLKKKLSELQKRRNEMDHDEYNAEYVTLTQKILYGVDGNEEENDKQEADDDGDDEENDGDIDDDDELEDYDDDDDHDNDYSA